MNKEYCTFHGQKCCTFACHLDTIATSFNTLLEKLLLRIASKHHAVAKLTHASQGNTEVEVISDTITKILCVWTLASQDKKIFCLPSQHDDFL